jgi:hypothetical protein
MSEVRGGLDARHIGSGRRGRIRLPVLVCVGAVNTETVQLQILSQSAGNPRRYQLTPDPSDEWGCCFDRCRQQLGAEIRQSLPGVTIRRVPPTDIATTGISRENSTDVDVIVRSLVKQANHRVQLNAVNR